MATGKLYNVWIPMSADANADIVVVVTNDEGGLIDSGEFIPHKQSKQRRSGGFAHKLFGIESGLVSHVIGTQKSHINKVKGFN